MTFDPFDGKRLARSCVSQKVNVAFDNLDDENVTWTGGIHTFQFAFTNAPDADFCVLIATNLPLPLSWTALGEAIQTSSGQYEFTDTPATNLPHRYYRVVSP